ncbi:MAG TPA: hypothetical protein VNK03_03590 [Gammaproteobacteria bacterium]|nr:hypothetical protein [Gammaproteobacteria bacterium]
MSAQPPDIQPFEGDYTVTSISAFKKEMGLSKTEKKIEVPKKPWWQLWKKKEKEKKKEEGKQKKAPNTGFYKQGKQLYYIKQSAEFPADDIAEVATSHLLQLAIGDQAVMYSAVCHKTLKNSPGGGPSVYLVSEVSPECKTLKEHVLALPKGFKFPDQKVIMGADLVTKKNKIALSNSLTPHQRKELAKVLAGCLWVREPDCQYGNILLGPLDATGKGEVKKFDNGWGLVDICGSNNARVKLFKKEAPISPLAAGTHPRFSGIPTNHLNDYPGIIRSQDFVDALEEILKKTTEDNIKEHSKKIVDDIKNNYKDANPNNALNNFAKHIGLDVSGKSADELGAFIEKSLAKRLKERADSMAVLQCLLKIDLALDKDLSAKEAEALVSELQKVIRDRFRIGEDGDEVKNLTIGEIIPPYKPPRAELMKKLMNIVDKKDPQKNDMIRFCELMSEGGKSKSVKELGKIPPIVAQDKDLPAPDLMKRLSIIEGDATALKGGGNHNPAPPVASLLAKNLHATNTKTGEAQTYKTFSTYCDILRTKLESTSPALLESQKSLEIESLGPKITVTHLPNNAINTSLPDNLEDLKKVFPKVLAANMEAGLTRLSPSGSFETIKYMTEEILNQGLEPVFTKETKKLLETHGYEEARFIAGIKEKIEFNKVSAHLTTRLSAS